MPTVKVFPGFENVLVVSGSDVYSENRKWVTDFLDGADTSPKIYRDGLYDFTYQWWDGLTGNASHNTWDPSTTPRPNRGRIVNRGVPSGSTVGTVGSDVYTMMHELLHHWMVDNQMTVDGVEVAQSQEFVTKASAGELDFGGPPMIARQNSHWSPYWQSDDSVLDGTAYDLGPRVGAFRRWDSKRETAYSIQVDGLTISPTTSYSDLDLFAMGAMPASEAYKSDGGAFRWMEPRFVGPLGFRMGVMAAVRNATGRIKSSGSTSVFEFGFQDDYDKVVLTRNGTQIVEQRVPKFDPFTFEAGMVFRIVRSGGLLHFDMRVDDTASQGCLNAILSALSLRTRGQAEFDYFDPLLDPQGAADFRAWTRVHTIDLDDFGDDLEIVAGMTAQRWDAGWVDLTFGKPRLRFHGPLGNSITRELDVGFGPAEKTEGAWLDGWDVWAPGTARNFLPTSGTEIWRDDRKRLHLNLPHRMFDGTSWVTVPVDQFEFDPPTADGGARVLWKMPEDFFAFAASAAPGYSLVVPWIGGGMNGKYLLGIEHKTPVSAVTFPGIDAEKTARPPGDTYRVAHIIVAKDESDITVEKVAAVDTRRRAMELAFAEVTGGRRFIDTTLEDS